METWMMHHFSLANPVGDEQEDVPKLLRRVAASLEELGDVEVQDLVLHSEFNEYGRWPSLTVYFSQEGEPASGPGLSDVERQSDD